MYFKEWCLASYGISRISEGKVINRVFLSARAGINRPLEQILVDYGGCLTAYQGRQGVTFTQDNYNQLMLQLKYQFLHLNQGYFDVDKFEIYKSQCIRGFDSENIMQYRVPPNVHLSFCGEKEKNDFLQRFAFYHPFLSYDVLNEAASVEISSTFLNSFYEIYYKAPVSPQPALELMKEHKLRLEKLVRQIEKNKLAGALDGAQVLSLDYDNKEATRIRSQDACSAYAMSLKIFAELHRFAFSLNDFRAFYNLANLFAAHDRYGGLHQSLKTDVCFIDYMKSLYRDYLNSLPKDRVKTYGYPILSELPDDMGKTIQSVINRNTQDLLYGNPSAQFNKEGFCATRRFLPDEQGHSEVDEIILQGGEMAWHFANFRLIKIGIKKNGLQAGLNETAHYYEYFKVVNNLGANCHYPDSMSKLCLGTYVTRILPCGYSETKDRLVHLSINPYRHPKEYQRAMESTLSKLIVNERLLQLYRKPSLNGDLSAIDSLPGSKEALEWEYQYSFNQILSGIPYHGILRYRAQDMLHPEKKYPCFVSNQRAYMQESGSCLIFSLKSIASNVLGSELATLHLSFMQQFNAQKCIAALKNKIALLDKTIESRSRLLDNRISFQSNAQPSQHMNGFFTQGPVRILQRPRPVASSPSYAI